MGSYPARSTAVHPAGRSTRARRPRPRAFPAPDQTASETPCDSKLRGWTTVVWRIPSIPSSNTRAPEANVTSVPSPRNAGAASDTEPAVLTDPIGPDQPDGRPREKDRAPIR